jgi:hypothetical protein
MKPYQKEINLLHQTGFLEKILSNKTRRQKRLLIIGGVTILPSIVDICKKNQLEIVQIGALSQGADKSYAVDFNQLSDDVSLSDIHEDLHQPFFKSIYSFDDKVSLTRNQLQSLMLSIQENMPPDGASYALNHYTWQTGFDVISELMQISVESREYNVYRDIVFSGSEKISNENICLPGEKPSLELNPIDARHSRVKKRTLSRRLKGSDVEGSSQFLQYILSSAVDIFTIKKNTNLKTH